MSYTDLTQIRAIRSDHPGIVLPDGTRVSLAIVPYIVVEEILSGDRAIQTVEQQMKHLKLVLCASNPKEIATKAIEQLAIDDIGKVLALAFEPESKRIVGVARKNGMST